MPILRSSTMMRAALAGAVEMESKRAAMSSYPTGGRRREVSGNNHDRGVGEGLEETAPSSSCCLHIDAEAAVELRLGALQRRMHDIATQDHGCSLRAHHDADVAGCVPRPGLDPYAVVECVVRRDELGLATVPDR